MRTLVVIALIYFAIRVVTRVILPLLIDKGVKNMQQKMQDQQRQHYRNNRPEGEVTIQSDRRKTGTGNQKGEYVDFEEVD